MPLTPRSEPRRKGSPRWFLVFWLALIAARTWSMNRPLSISLLVVAAVILLTGLRRTESVSGGGTMPTPSPGSPNLPRSIETVAMPTAPPDARPIEPEVGGATGKIIMIAIVLAALGFLVAFLVKSQGWKITP